MHQLPGERGVVDVDFVVGTPDRPTGLLAAATEPRGERVVTFDVDYSAAAVGSQFMLVALVHSTADPMALAGADLRAMILGSRHAAARSIHVI